MPTIRTYNLSDALIAIEGLSLFLQNKGHETEGMKQKAMKL